MKTVLNIGLSAVEKNTQIKDLDMGIVALEGQIEKELKKL